MCIEEILNIIFNIFQNMNFIEINWPSYSLTSCRSLTHYITETFMSVFATFIYTIEVIKLLSTDCILIMIHTIHSV